jgi:DNA-binding transcriptional LysR family regulator
VAWACSYRRAAEALHTSQPASQHIRELETELTVKVFDRLGRSVASLGRPPLKPRAARVRVGQRARAIGELQASSVLLVVGAAATGSMSCPP